MSNSPIPSLLPFVALGVLLFALGLWSLRHWTTEPSENRSAASRRTANATDGDEPRSALARRHAAGELDDGELARRLDRFVQLEELRTGNVGRTDGNET